jgi:DNA polymerase-1
MFYETVHALRRTGFDMSIPPGIWVETVSEAERWRSHFLRTWRRNNGLGVDTETTGISKVRDRVVVASISDDENRISFPARLLPIFKEALLENPDIPLDGTNIGFDAHMLANTGVQIIKAGPWRDTKVMSFLRNENNVGRHGLKECTVDHFGRTTPHFNEIFGRTVPARKNRAGLITRPAVTVGDLVTAAFNPGLPPDPANYPPEEFAELMAAYQERLERFQRATDYASLDAYNSTSLRGFFDRELDAIEIAPGYTLKHYFYSSEVPFTKVLWKMERRGITVDRGHLEEQRLPMEREMESIQADFANLLGELPNLDSVHDVRRIFFQVLRKEPIKWTSGGTSGNRQPSVDFDVLDTWAGQGDIWAQKLIDFRSIAKIHGTYILGLEEWIDPNYRIHTSLNQIGAVTMRLSSSEPNLQNIPRPGDDKYKIRDAFTHGARKMLVIADYAQLEMRLMAHFSGDEKMIDAIKRGIDLHCLTVAEMYGIPYDDVMAAVTAKENSKKGGPKPTERQKELLAYRQAAKATGFGIIYGIGGPHLAANLTKDLKKLVTPEEGIQLIAKWFNVFPGVKAYIDRTKANIQNYGFVQTLVGRFRRFGDLRGMSRMDAARELRQGVNSIIQGSASDLAKKAMLLVDEDPDLKDCGAEMLLQIHDELILECDDDPEAIEITKRRLEEIMGHPFDRDLLVPTPAEAGSGHTWAEAK